MVLGGQSGEYNLLDAFKTAVLKGNVTLEQIRDDFSSGREGVITFEYNGIDETMHYIPVDGTDWMLTYLIRESLISEQVSHITQDITNRSLFQSVIVLLVMSGFFLLILLLNRKTSLLLLERETSEAANRVKQKEMERRLKLQDQLLDQERRNETLTLLHDMLNSGPWYMDFDEHGKLTGVNWSSTFRQMVGYTSEEDFPNKLESWSDLLHEEDKERVLTQFQSAIDDYSGKTPYDVEYRLLTRNQGWRWFHAIGQLTRRPDGSPITYVGIFVDITQHKQMEQQLADQQETLKSALAQAEEANAAKTSFLSSMSHEIRTPPGTSGKNQHQCQASAFPDQCHPGYEPD